ncbi:hypothetical protein A3L11_10665 [Thermococcus siculi]|uniref:Uncharacterized protein n=1 Tax=Thermococcus siculi TaxID=72803 RepID=A0A2Z2N075_9EURY|nr:hypothetical protein [Thermococcus siculi]ASJ09670.1 hypothetical protein A3L11_10665 [Thermococcus siculi]
MRGLLRFFIRLPILAFRVAGLFRITNRARRNFKGELEGRGLPEDVVGFLVEEFDPGRPLRKGLGFFSGGRFDGRGRN